MYTANQSAKADEEARKQQQQAIESEKAQTKASQDLSANNESKANADAALADEKKRAAASAGATQPDQASATLLTGSGGVANSLLNVARPGSKKPGSY